MRLEISTSIHVQQKYPNDIPKHTTPQFTFATITAAEISIITFGYFVRSWSPILDIHSTVHNEKSNRSQQQKFTTKKVTVHNKNNTAKQLDLVSKFQYLQYLHRSRIQSFHRIGCSKLVTNQIFK